MNYTPKDYAKLLGTPGFSDALLENHFTLYQGYVANTNKLLDILGLMAGDGKAGTPEYAELKRRLGWEFNGMRLHELYFGNLGGQAPLDPSSKLGRRIAEQFGDVDSWERDFRATGAMRGVGWAVLYEDSTNGRLIDFWIDQHHVSHPAGCAPLLVLDVFEHAFLGDYQLRRADYVEAFMKAVDWVAVGLRLR